MKEFLTIYCIFVAAMSAIAFGAYFSDKRKAKKGKWRTKESLLLALGVLGGALGALLAMNLFRHKTRHWYFWLVNALFFAVQIAFPVVLCLLYF